MWKHGNLELWNESITKSPSCPSPSKILVGDLMGYDRWHLIVNTSHDITRGGMVFSLTQCFP